MTSGSPAGVRPPRAAVFALVALLVPLTLAALAFGLAREYRIADQTRLVARAAFERRLAEGDLLSSVKDAETGQRGYVITGNRDFLGPYRSAQQELPAEIAHLRRLTADEPAQAARLDDLTRLIDLKFSEMDAVLKLRDTAGATAAMARVSTGNGRLLMDDIRAVADRMMTAEDMVRTRTREESLARSKRIQEIVWWLVGAIAVVLSGVLAWIWLARRARYWLQLASAESAARFEAIFSGTIDAIALLNPSGTIEVVNRAATAMLGYQPGELLRRDVSVLLDIAPGEGSFFERIGLQDGELRNPRRVDCVARHKDGRPVPVDVALGLMPLPDGVHVVAAIRDVSDRKAIERMKDQFVSTVSHELRTPLTSIIGALGLLRGEKAGALPDAAKRLVEIAENNSRRLIRLINDILDIEKMGAGQMRFDTAPLDLAATLRGAVLGSEGLAADRGVRLIGDLPDREIIVRGDAERLLQVVSNLVSNALRFTPAGKAVRVSLEEHGGKAIVAIDDEGPGVPENFRDRIFKRFAQAPGETPTGGTGLGLAISQEIINAHDGAIWFENRPEGGARFAFSLDVVRQPAAVGLNCPHILICESDAESAAALASMVEAEGYLSSHVGSAEEARRALREGSYDALLLDLNLPGGGGLNVIRMLRSSADTHDMPIILLSGHAGDADDTGLALDMIDWLNKPVDPTKLVDAVRVAVNRAATSRPTLLHVDDDIDLLDVTAAALDGHGRLLRATSLARARAVLATERPDIVILDLGLPDGSGAELIPMLRDGDGRAIPTIIYSAQEVSADVEQAVQAVLVKSRRSLPNLAGAIQNILSKAKGGRREPDRNPVRRR